MGSSSGSSLIDGLSGETTAVDVLCCLKQNLTSGEFVLRGFSLVFLVCIGALLHLYLC